MLTVKMVRFGRRAAGLTFGTTLTTSSAPVALGAASRKVLAAVRKYRLYAAYPLISSTKAAILYRVCIEVYRTRICSMDTTVDTRSILLRYTFDTLRYKL